MRQTFEHKRYQSRKIRAFSLAELMTAVGVLGIGMMMIAMAFPVALDQTRQAVELSTSQLVFNEAVNTLKTQVKWTELEAYINWNDNYGALEATYRLGANDTSSNDKRIYLLSFDETVSIDPSGTGTNDFFDNLQNINCVYSADNTYGWTAAVQKLSNRTYKFWIFVIREPKGFDSVTNLTLSILDISHSHSSNLASSNQISFTDLNYVLRKEEVILGDDGNLYSVTDVGEPDGNNVSVMLNQNIPAANTYFAHVTGTGFTRKNPVLTVYQTVISY